MKNSKLLGLLAILISGLMFFQCTSDDPIYVAGADGQDGVDGVDGVDGSAAACIACHAASHREPIFEAWADSGHGSGGSWARGTNSGCAQCHNNDGYIDYLSGDFFETDDDGDLVLDINDEPIPTANPDGYQVSYPISCTGCHDNHRSFDFDNDGNDYAVRHNAPVKLVLDPTIVVDLSNNVDELGLSNACVVCHQPRTSYPVPAGTADVTITSRRFGPHHGPQGTLYEGVLGANIPGSQGYPGVGSGPHRNGASCTSCHMGEADAEGNGGHTWAPTLNTCVACHTGMTEIPDVENGEGIGVWASQIAILKNLLLDAGYINEDGYVINAGEYASSSNPLVVPVAHAQAIWNYKTLTEDKSNGIHNPAYTRALLQNSIEALQD